MIHISFLLGNDILLKFSLNKVTPYRYLVQVLIILTYSPEKKKLVHDSAFLKLVNIKDLYLHIQTRYLG